MGDQIGDLFVAIGQIAILAPIPLARHEQAAVDGETLAKFREEASLDVVRQTRSLGDVPANHRFGCHLVHVLASGAGAANVGDLKLLVWNFDSCTDRQHCSTHRPKGSRWFTPAAGPIIPIPQTAWRMRILGLGSQFRFPLQGSGPRVLSAEDVEPLARMNRPMAITSLSTTRQSARDFGQLMRAALRPAIHVSMTLVFASACVAQETSEGSNNSSLDPLPKRLGVRLDGDDWPTLLGAHQDGRSSETGIRTQWETDPPRILWQAEVGEGYAIGSTSLGRYVHFDRDGDEARVQALQAETGEALWEFRYPTDYVDMYGYDGGPRCSPVIDSGRVYLLGAEGQLHCLSLADGRKLWSRNTSEEYGVVQNFFGVGSTPVVHGDLLYVMIGGSPAEDQALARGGLDEARGNGSGVVAFDKRTGEEKWRVSDELASYSSLKVARIAGKDCVLAFARGGLLAIEATQGQETHHFPWRARILESVNASMPVVQDDQVLISETYGPGAAMLKLTPQGFETLWADPERSRVKILQTHWNTPVFDNGYVYASSGRHTQNAELRCVRWSDGVVQWSEPDLTRCSLTLVDGHLISQGEYGDLRLLKVNPEKFEQVGYLELLDPRAAPAPLPLLKYPCWAAPVVSHGLLYVRGVDKVVCLELIPER